MSIRINKRRSSSLNSNNLLSASLRRRNSITASELEQMHTILLKSRQFTAPFLFLIFTGSPIFIFTYHAMLVYNGPIIEALSRELSWIEICSRLSTLLAPTPLLVILLLMQFQLLFLWYLPAEDKEIVVVPEKRVNIRYNAFESNVLICLIYVLGATIGLYEGNVIFDNWLGTMVILSLFAVALQVYLFLMELPDNINEEQNFAFDIFYGRHLQPVIFGIDVKSFITNRIALSLWSLYVISALYAQRKTFGRFSAFKHFISFFILRVFRPTQCPKFIRLQNDDPESHVVEFTASLITCAILQLIYVARRHWFEYLTRNLDFINDRMGFYRIWGVLVFLPTIYITPITLLAQTKTSATLTLCFISFAICFFFQFINAGADRQKFKFRAANGQIKISGKDPFYINAKFRRENGDPAMELLLGSGYWSKARHLNYTAEFFTYAAWSAPATCVNSVIGFAPVIFLGILLYNRMQRDETRCLLKYTHYWLQYVTKVPYLFLPGVY